jgi:prepilin-type N-terminal cleavage/methylation domain-containing protein
MKDIRKGNRVIRGLGFGDREIRGLGNAQYPDTLISKSRYPNIPISLMSALTKRTNGFTFIELLITLAVIAICFLPLMRMFSVSLEQAYQTSDLTTARYLAQEGMERVKNLGFTEAQLEAIGDVWEPDLDKPALELNGRFWRTLRKIVRGSDPLEIRIQVYQITSKPANQLTGKPIVEVVTLVEDLDWTPVE